MATALAFTITVATASTAPASASATTTTDEGWITNGTGVEEVADAAPCTPAAVNDALEQWGNVGPIVCFPKPAGATGWDLDYEWSQCIYRYLLVVGVYDGDCLWTIDEGDHVKVWGSLGVFYVNFTINWQYN